MIANGPIRAGLIVGISLSAVIATSVESRSEDVPQVCSATSAALPITFLSKTTIKTPNIGIESEIEVGQSMVATVTADLYPDAIILAQPIDYAGVYKGAKFNIHIPAGTILAESDNAAAVHYESKEGTIKFEKEPEQKTGARIGVIIPKHPPSTTKVFWYESATFWKPSNLIEYDFPEAALTRKNCILFGKDSFKRELVYSGVSQGTVSILYREFINDMARPAFSQDLRYDLSAGDEIGYKGARFRIIKASNTGIKYQVLKPLD